jgi:hypothetical protein
MGLFHELTVLAIRELVGEGGEIVLKVLSERFTDHSQKLTRALSHANERAWRTLEVALAGDSWWDRVKNMLGRSEDQAFRAQVRAFLDAAPLAELQGKTQFRQLCLEELQTARKAGLFAEGNLDF